MKKKLMMILLAVGVLTLAGGCGDKKDTDSKSKTESKEDTKDEKIPTNSDGKVVAVDVDDITKYVELGEYKNLEVNKTVQEVADAEVDQYLEQQMVYEAEEITEDRPVQDKDSLNIDYTGYMDGAEFEGGSATGETLLIGSGQFIEGFESGLIGKKKGEEVTLDLAFPDPYTVNPDLSGKAVQFKVKINSISASPELTDEWVQSKTEYKTVDEYKKSVKDFLQQSTDSNFSSQFKSDMFAKLVENSKILEYPKELLESQKKTMESRMLTLYAEPNGMTLEEYYTSQNISAEDAASMIEETAKKALEQGMLVQALLDAEKVSFTQKQYQEILEDFAKDYGFEDAAALNKAYNDEDLIKQNVLWNEACKILEKTAKVTEVPAEQ